MNKRPSIKTLVLQSHSFLWNNAGLALFYIKQLLIPAIIIVPLAFLAEHLLEEQYDDIGKLIYFFTMLYFHTCFALMWYRANLLGPSRSHKINALRLKLSEFKFITTSITLFITIWTPTFVFLAYTMTIFYMIGTNQASMTSLLIYSLSMAALTYITIKATGYCFMLPAQAIGESTSFKQADNISEDLTIHLIAAKATAWMIASIASFIPGAIAIVLLLVIEYFNADLLPEELNSTASEYILSLIFLEAPWIIIYIYLTAINAGILSHLYKWATASASGPSARS
ncbi:hypothetical protein [Micavibrio aeruginosavorus]|uniref:Uncharacterized protein n=1 Tax=Micavibrio aeruginosavorus EPB TaxID=349215 RepID=M4VF36_9BACT|nr:hypothetical protein [Micavibrio aeruginosavorus]AGH97838.1 hypothetical protein A11S_1020 [Micavibrio aeruginosavorus EPB]